MHLRFATELNDKTKIVLLQLADKLKKHGMMYVLVNGFDIFVLGLEMNQFTMMSMVLPSLLSYFCSFFFFCDLLRKVWKHFLDVVQISGEQRLFDCHDCR